MNNMGVCMLWPFIILNHASHWDAVEGVKGKLKLSAQRNLYIITGDGHSKVLDMGSFISQIQPTFLLFLWKVDNGVD